MESSEVESIISESLKPDGYSNFVFEWLIKLDQKNTWECVVKADGKQYFKLYVDDQSKQILSKEKIKGFHKVEINETVVHTDHIRIDQTGVRKIENKRMNVVLIGLFIIAPIIGYLVEPFIGLIVGFLIGGISFVIGSYIVPRERIHFRYEK